MAPNPIRTHPSRFVLIPLLLGALALGATAAQNPAAPGLVPQAVDEPAPVHPGLMAVPREELSPRLLEIRDFLEGRDQQVKELTARYRAATDNAEAMRLMREIHDLKSGTEAGLLEIQLRWARQENNREAVAQLEETLARVEAGPKVLAPGNRPRPERQR